MEDFGDGFEPKIDDLSMVFYFAMVTMTTVGYGDILPVSETARLFTISMIMSGIAVLATPAMAMNTIIKLHQRGLDVTIITQ